MKEFSKNELQEFDFVNKSVAFKLYFCMNFLFILEILRKTWYFFICILWNAYLEIIVHILVSSVFLYLNMNKMNNLNLILKIQHFVVFFFQIVGFHHHHLIKLVNYFISCFNFLWMNFNFCLWRINFSFPIIFVISLKKWNPQNVMDVISIQCLFLGIYHNVFNWPCKCAITI